ncbi:hypothetical protein DFR72_109322 [Lentzea flaviverrucosa]|uniref:Uncharacterized protein n=2 Tax=Lentzea flaviverrucosa TaxID=200379 RepID=A0A1H9D4I7_9PSEU|nr:hypothetical protein DFR72_109322 [Lentzea flaviverrucosa]SEQ08269.1 hypothetical protein SAMN05216195_101977 [Lentzea flaviverrucosa]
MTDLSTLSLPEWARGAAVVESPVLIKPEWWRDEISARHLPGTPPVEDRITRAGVRAPADDVFTLLWRTLAWGSGRYLRLNAQRLTSIAADVPRCEKLLTEAADRARSDPGAAFALFRPGVRNEIRYLGPSFFTKFLYFAGGGAPDHPCLILDRRVATVLRERCGWTSLHRKGPWPAETYERYCGLLARWGRENHCTPDEIELTLFNIFSVDQN